MGSTFDPSTLHRLHLESLHDRATGCLIGSVLGDIIGLYTEFLPESQCKEFYPSGHFSLVSPVTPLHGDSHRDRFVSRAWTDDTDHALLILCSYIHNQGNLDTQDFAKRLKHWIEQGLRALDRMPLGVGATVKKVVIDKDFEEHPEQTAYKYWAAGGFFGAANGSLMRTHVLGALAIRMTLEETFELATRYSILTHPDMRCVVSCCIGTALCRGLILGEVQEECHVDEIIQQAMDWCVSWQKDKAEKDPDYEGPRLIAKDLEEVINPTDLKSLQLDDSQKMGFVYKTLGSGLFCLRQAMRQISKADNPLDIQVTIFEPLITDLIMMGGDADTNACFAGALLGSYVGFRSLPAHWRGGIRDKGWLFMKAEAMCQILGIARSEFKFTEHEDAAIDGGRRVLSREELEDRANKLMYGILEKMDLRKKEAAKPQKQKKTFGFFKK